MTALSRRRFLSLAAALGASAAWSSSVAAPSKLKWSERRDLFPEGVASGDPQADSVILWTRRPPGPDGATPRLTVEVAEDKASWLRPPPPFPRRATGPRGCWSAG